MAFGVWRLAFGVWLFLLSHNDFADNENSYQRKITDLATLLWGSPTKTQIHFYPFGYHSNHDFHSQPNNKQWLVGGVFNGLTAGSFISSCNKRIFYQGVERQVYGNNFIAVNYLLGVMEGYGGSSCDLSKDIGPILGHDPGPLAALNFKLYVSKHVSIDVISYGVGGLGGVSYIF